MKLNLDTLPVLMILTGLLGMVVLTIGSLIVSNPEPLIAGMGLWGGVVTAGGTIAGIRGSRKGNGTSANDGDRSPPA